MGIVNLLREEAILIAVKRTETISPEPGDDPICACAKEGAADFIVTLNGRDFPKAKLKARVISPWRSTSLTLERSTKL
ncbi:MAG: hypothetical protein DMG69_23345 [Acidobacteria bacterium]|nr:MAG: hypothetical protein DMG69_23345 [Acidobacteriota bacterium]